MITKSPYISQDLADALNAAGGSPLVTLPTASSITGHITTYVMSQAEVDAGAVVFTANGPGSYRVRGLQMPNGNVEGARLRIYVDTDAVSLTKYVQLRNNDSLALPENRFIMYRNLSIRCGQFYDIEYHNGSWAGALT